MFVQFCVFIILLLVDVLVFVQFCVCIILLLVLVSIVFPGDPEVLSLSEAAVSHQEGVR